MMPGPVVRFFIEAVFLVLVAVGAGLAHLSAPAIVGVMLVAWIIVALIERAISAELSKRAAELRLAEAQPAPPEAASHVNVLPSVPQITATPLVPTAPPPEPEAPASPAAPSEPSPAAPPATPPMVEAAPFEAAPVEAPPLEAAPLEAAPLEDAAAPAPAATEPVREPEPEPAPATPPVVEPLGHVEETPEPVAAEAAPPRLEAVPTPPPEPAPPPAATPEPPEPQVVVQFVPQGPRAWNLWELERVARDNAGGGDVVRDEEISFLLMYLREFAAADGALPVDFDGLVRDAFGDLLAAAR